MHSSGRNNINNFSPLHPFPALGNLKRHFILCNFGQGLLFFDFALLNQPLLFCLNLLIQFFARAFLRPLLHELALYRQL